MDFIGVITLVVIIVVLILTTWMSFSARRGRKVYSNGKLLCESIYNKENSSFTYFLYYPSGKTKNKIQRIEGRRQLLVYSEEFELLCQAEVDIGYGKKNQVFILHGPIQGFYNNGHLKFTGKCKSNKFHGDFEFYAENGNLLLSLVFKNGSPLRGLIYNEDGTPRELTVAHIHNIILDYDFDNMLIDLSWTEQIL